MTYFFLFAVSCISAGVQTVTGFGYGLIVMSIFPFFLPLEMALAVSTVMSLCLNIAILSRRWKTIRFKLVWVPVLCASLGAFSGLALISEHPSSIYKRILGVFLMVLAIWFVFLSKRVRLRPTPLSSAAVGIISGVCGGLFSISGPPMVLYYVAILDDMEEYMSTTQFFFFLNNIVLIILRNALGLWPTGILPACAASFAGLLCGFLLGGAIFRRADHKKIRQCVYIVMALSGLSIALGL